jgi:WD40 repeat protein
MSSVESVRPEDGNLIFSTSKGAIVEYDLINKRIAGTYPNLDKASSILEIGHDSLFAGNHLGVIQQYSFKSRKLLHTYSDQHTAAITSMVLFSDNKSLISADKSGHIVKWNVHPPSALSPPHKPFKSPITKLLLTSNNKYLFLIGKNPKDLLQLNPENYLTIKNYSSITPYRITAAIADCKSEFLFLGDSQGDVRIISINAQKVLKIYTKIYFENNSCLKAKKRNKDDWSQVVDDFIEKSKEGDGDEG